MAADAPGPETAPDAPVGDGPPAARSRKRRLGWTTRLLLWPLVLGVLLFVVVTQTAPGQRWLTGLLAERAARAIGGRISTSAVRSADLLTGVRLYDLEVDGPDGVPFLRADSVVAGYSWATFLSGNIILTSLDLFQPRVFISRGADEERSNVQRLFSRPGPDSTGSGPTRQIEFRDVRVLGGSVEVLTPVEGEAGPRAVVVDGPDGGRLRRIAFEEINGVFSRAILASRRVSGVQITLDSLGLLGRLFQEPVRLDDAVGVATWKDGRLDLDARQLALPGTRAQGRLWVDFGREDGLGLGFDLQTSGIDLDDVRWADPRLPEGTLRGGIRLVLDPSVMEWTFTGAELRAGGDRVTADGRVFLGPDGARLSGLDLTVSPLDLARIEPWLKEPLPLDGHVRGRLSLDGTRDSLVTAGRLVLEPPDGAMSTGDFGGVLHLGESPGATAFRMDLDPLDYSLLGRLLPDSLPLEGRGRLAVEVTGHLDQGLRFTGEAGHRAPGAVASRILADGAVRRGDDGLVLDVQGDLAPLSFSALRRYRPDLPLEGSVTGSVRARGPLSDLVVSADLDGPTGSATLEATLDVRDPTASYRVDGELRDVDLGTFVPRLPEGGAFNGRVSVEGSGLSPDSARVRGNVWASRSRVGSLDVDTVAVAFLLADGILTVDTVDARARGIDVVGGGAVAGRAGRPGLELRLRARSDSLSLLRPLFMGENIIARDTLRAVDLERLALEGVDPGALPEAADVAMEGRGVVDLVVGGSLDRVDVRGTVALDGIVYRRDLFEGVRATFSAEDVFGGRVPLRLDLETDSLHVAGRSFASGTLAMDYGEDGGWVDVEVRRRAGEDYAARGFLRLDSLGGSLDLDSLNVSVDSSTWRLDRRAHIEWDEDAVRMDTVVVVRRGEDPMELQAAGVLPREGPADFTLDAKGVHLERLARLTQREDLTLRGHVDLSLRVTGTADAPVMAGTLAAQELGYRDWDLTRAEGTFTYRDREVGLDVDAWRDGLRVLRVDGTVPADLAFTPVEDRIPRDRDMDLHVVADSLPAAFAVTAFDNLEDVVGTVAGDFRIAGTVADPSPSGTLVMQNAGWRVPTLGVRQQDVQGTLTVGPDETVDVDARARSVGTAAVTGTVRLRPLSDPAFDLVLDFDGFQAVDRRDVTGRVSGTVGLTGTYRKPVVRGLQPEGRGLKVDEGVLYVEEFRRNTEVVDLSDPRFMQLVIDTTLAGGRPLVAASRNPFFQNLLVNVDLAVERDTWLRSPDLNVEIGGDLIVTYDRASRDLVLVGGLQAVRGSYLTLGRRFDVTGGTVEFVGIPGINPDMDIQASTRVRRAGGDPLDIGATVSGTLANPRVQLTSDERALGESDLVSYLVFGRPSYELTTGQAGQLARANPLLGSGVSLLAGTFSNRLSSLVAQQWGLDYFAINQPGQIGIGSSSASQAALTSLEVGRYLSGDLFAVLVVRPLFQVGSTQATPLGARLEWQATDLYRVEAFLDDRFLRSGAVGFRELGFSTSLVAGFSVFRDWAY